MTPPLLLATRKGFMQLARRSNGWEIERVSFLGDNVTMLHSDQRTGIWYAGLNLGHFGVKLHRSTDRGATWNECAVPIYPEGAVYSVGPAGPDEPPKTKPASLQEIWALESGGPDQPNRLWAGTIPGGLFRSDDNGTSWQLVESLWNREERMGWFGGGKDHPGIHSICVDPRDSRRVTIGISCGGVWQTEDDGANWELLGAGLRAEYMPPGLQDSRNIQDPHLLVQCQSQPDQMWIQHHNGIFYSSDRAKNWIEIKPTNTSSFGFAVCVDPKDGKKAWFVPAIKDECRVPRDAKLIVTKTEDAGQSFKILNAGLPQGPNYEIVYRHAMALDSTGEVLAFGTTTGGLYISENCGQKWETVSQTLPPIYTVRFG